ncbi:hypothetical protein KSP40_PGU018476 [Platanthera guangdongensis]|uniref:Uncharacterized protein n=1 Tax=Platanthera guangdongensis TaxID=2320717 RepID=A0ABR2N2K7_9ASPA
MDLDSFFLEVLKEFMKEELETNLSRVVSENLTRKIVKGIFMPIIYGKTKTKNIAKHSQRSKSLDHFSGMLQCCLCLQDLISRNGMPSIYRLDRVC